MEAGGMTSPRWLWLLALLALVLFVSPALAGIDAWLPGVITESRAIYACIFVAALALYLMLKR
jgi:hypothetical protein